MLASWSGAILNPLRPSICGSIGMPCCHGYHSTLVSESFAQCTSRRECTCKHTLKVGKKMSRFTVSSPKWDWTLQRCTPLLFVLFVQYNSYFSRPVTLITMLRALREMFFAKKCLKLHYIIILNLIAADTWR